MSPVFYREPVILDTETTGLNTGLKLDVPLQIAVTDLKGAELFNSYIQPPHRVETDLEALAVHKIGASVLNEAPRFEEVFPELEHYLMAPRIYIYNAAFDVRLLLNAAYHAGVLLPELSYRCLMLEYAQHFGAPGPVKGEARWIPLGAAYEQQFGSAALKALGTAHDALVDCKLAAALHDRMSNDPEALVTAEGLIPTELERATLKTTVKGDPYLVLSSAGGASVNVFNRQFRELAPVMPVYELVNMLDRLPEGESLPLERPVTVAISYRSAWPELKHVIS